MTLNWFKLWRFFFHNSFFLAIAEDEDLQSKDRDGISGADEVKGDIPVNKHEENVPKSEINTSSDTKLL